MLWYSPEDITKQLTSDFHVCYILKTLSIPKILLQILQQQENRGQFIAACLQLFYEKDYFSI